MLHIRPDTSDVSVFHQVYVKKALDVPCLVSPRLVLDLGAYTGISTRWFCDWWPSAHVIAVEPHPGRALLIRRNAPNAEVHAVAVSNRRGVTALVRAGRGEWSDALGDVLAGRQVAMVETTTVDEILDGRLPDVVKVDVEGAEVEVFESAGDWLAHAALLIVEAHDRLRPGCERAVLDAVRRTGRPHRRVTKPGSRRADFAVVFLDRADRAEGV